MADQDGRVYDSLEEHLPLWGWRLLFHLAHSGLVFRRYAPEEFERRYGTWNQRSGKAGKAGVYDSKRHQIAISERYWSGSILHHELGHVLDRMVSPLHTSFSTGLWHGFAPSRAGFLTDYAASHPQEYLAVCLERFLCDDADGLWLERHDPGMHAFLDALFELSSASS